MEPEYERIGREGDRQLQRREDCAGWNDLPEMEWVSVGFLLWYWEKREGKNVE